ncbi:MAG: L-rhamnose mutarotase [Segetibacter sp.]
MKRYCLALDLVDRPELIEEYEYWHKPENRRPEIMKSITEAGKPKIRSTIYFSFWIFFAKYSF